MDCSIEMGLRQEIEGSQGEQLESVPCGQISQDEEDSRSREELSPVQIREKETTYFSFSRSRDFPDYADIERLLGGQRGVIHDAKLPTGLFGRIHLG